MIIDYGSRPPVPEFTQSNTSHLQRYRSVYGSSERAAGESGTDTFAEFLAMVLSRSCPDDAPLADEILNVCRADVLARLSPE